VLGLGSGVGVSLLAELLDHSIKGLRELEAVLPYPVLAAFPHVTPFKRPRS
jgi:capsular polysaccharide biosynthesis protein